MCHDMEATTTFVDSGNVVRGSFDRRVLGDEISMKLESITDFLQKPYLVTSFSWSTGDLKNAGLYSMDIYDTLAATSYWTNKLQGFNLVRGRACIRIQINANPFQQGRLLAHFLPLEKNMTNLTSSYVAMHNAKIATKRQQPCVEIDCRDAVGVLEIPYIAPANWIARYANSAYEDVFTWGTFYLSVLSPLATGAAGETTVDVSVYLYFCDAEVAAPLVPQMAGGGPKKKFKAKSFSKKDVSQEEADSMMSKPLSSSLKTMSVAAGVLGGIPVLSEIAAPASWALDMAAGVASFLGWSKPLNNVQPSIISQQYNRYLATSDGVDISMPLGLRSDNKISISDGLSVYESDEMSFGFLKKVTTCIDTVPWTTGDISSTNIYTKHVGPSAIYEGGTKIVGAHTVNYRCGPPIFYLHNQFNLWRGGLEVTIKIIKTEMHTGRLQLTWSPVEGGAITYPTLSTSIVALREIIDVREGSVYTYTLPYLCPNHYMSTQATSGTLRIDVLNELKAPETCSSVVELLVYFNGADDFEFQAPGCSISRYGRTNLPFSPQTASEEVVESGVGGESAGSLETLYGEASCGEAFCSIKQLLARNSSVYLRSSLPTSANSASINVWPWFSGLAYMAAGTGVLSAPNAGGDVFSMMMPMYAMFRGGVNLTTSTAWTDTTGGGRNAPVIATILPLDSKTAVTTVVSGGLDGFAQPGATDWIASASPAGVGGYGISNAGIGMVSVRAPYYCKTKASLAVPQTTSDNIPVSSSTPLTTVNLISWKGYSSYNLFRSFPDDFQMCYFVGCPPLFESYV